MAVYNQDCKPCQSDDDKSLISGSGGGTRTPDTRIMIPVCSEDFRASQGKPDENSGQSNQTDSGWGVNENPSCGCYECSAAAAKANPVSLTDNPFGHPLLVRMFLCETCGNKRCPHATNHRFACTNSNAPGQAGSAYENVPLPTPETRNA